MKKNYVHLLLIFASLNLQGMENYNVETLRLTFEQNRHYLVDQIRLNEYSPSRDISVLALSGERNLSFNPERYVTQALFCIGQRIANLKQIRSLCKKLSIPRNSPINSESWFLKQETEKRILRLHTLLECLQNILKNPLPTTDGAISWLLHTSLEELCMYANETLNANMVS